LGAIGGILRATGGPGKYSTVSSVKNPALASSINRSIGQLPGYQSNVNNALGTFTSNWNANTPITQTQTNQQVGAMQQFYNGAMSNQLAQLRQQQQQAVNSAADIGVQQALRASNQSRLTGSGGLSSYNQRQSMAAVAPIRAQAALANAQQARNDLGYVTGNQLALAGQQQALENAQAQRALVPAQTQGQLLGQENQVMSGLTNLDQANTFYGLQKSPNEWADIADSLDQGILNAASIYSSMGTPGLGGQGHKEGGLIRGPGTGTSDSIPARLSKGEFVVPADVVHIPGVLPLLEKLRHLHNMHHVGKHQEALKIHMDHMKQRAKGKAGGGLIRGYAGGGLAGSAQQLGERVDKDLSTDWSGASFIPTGGAQEYAGASMGGGMSPAQPPSRFGGAQGVGGNAVQSPFLNMSNWGAIPQHWQDYANQMADRYSNPNSPHYIPEGTYE
jgi:hypothetical protein